MGKTVVIGARTHNLKGVDLELASGELVALTGPSGSGKSSLAIDTLHAEGQRRFVESFSPYARQFLERLDRPPATRIEPIAASVAIDRAGTIKSSRSTVATMSEIEPYLAALFAKESIPECPKCHLPAIAIDSHSAAQMLSREANESDQWLVTYPLTITDEHGYLEVRDQLAKQGYRRLLVDGPTATDRPIVRSIDDVKPTEAISKSVSVVVDRMKLTNPNRIQEAIERTWQQAGGRAIFRSDVGQIRTISEGLSCPNCGDTFAPPRPGIFSYNHPDGACPACKGFGRVIGIEWNKVIPDPSLSIAQGAIRAWAGKSAETERAQLAEFCRLKGIPTNRPWSELDGDQRNLLLFGPLVVNKRPKFFSVAEWFKWLETRTYKMHVRVFLSRYRSYDPCPTCHGSRLNSQSSMYRILGKNLPDWHVQSVAEARSALSTLTSRDAGGGKALEALMLRLSFLERVGLGHLSLDRPARTLSGGEAQRVALTSALATSLVSALFVVDEPTVGLHPSDVPPLISALTELARAGNAVVVIEHDAQVIAACDRVVELGPGAGPAGGQIVFSGPPNELLKHSHLSTSRVLSGAYLASSRRRVSDDFLTVRGASANNLKNIDVRFPKGVLTLVTGPSGSGKSTLVGDILARAAGRAIGEPVDDEQPLEHRKLEGFETFSSVLWVDQSALGRTSRGNAATYVKAWDIVRQLFARHGEMRGEHVGHPAGFYSFNTEGGRCDSCSGEGYETVEMQFLADVSVSCPSCKGRRFGEDALAIKLAGWSVADFLEHSVSDVIALCRSKDLPFELRGGSDKLAQSLLPLEDLGLGYLHLGQPLSTLSTGEAQRLRLCRTLSGLPRSAQNYLVIVDEPSAGLSASDLDFVIKAFMAYTDRHATVICVDHDPLLIASADHVIELGPGGGPEGGAIVFEGNPHELIEANTKTGRALADAKGRVVQARATSKQVQSSAIEVHKAREHNLKNVSVRIPHGKLVVVTGPSGSGKSTLAFDVIFAEGQRRFLETLSPYARQFLPAMPRADVDAVLSVPPSIALSQHTFRGGATSTVATVTEVAHYLRLLYAKIGTPYCPKCQVPIESFSPDLLWAMIESAGDVTVSVNAIFARKGTHLPVFEKAARHGFSQAIVDGVVVSADNPPKLAKTHEHTISILVGSSSRKGTLTSERLRVAMNLFSGAVTLKAKSREQTLSTERVCPSCKRGIFELDPRHFSFNTTHGQCKKCEGAGTIDEAVCPVCEGTRLAEVPRNVRISDTTYPKLLGLAVDESLGVLDQFQFSIRNDAKKKLLADAPIIEAERRLRFLIEVGLGYLALDRPAQSLSSGEIQRLRLAAQLGSGLTGALYVLDEPTIGLHARDTERLIENLRSLVKTGSTVLVVEHDADVIANADYLIDLGPAGGREGGAVVASGPPSEVLKNPDSPTGKAFSQPPPANALGQLKLISTPAIVLEGAQGHNLKGVHFSVQTERLTVVVGVSGSGKSTLVSKVFFPAVRKALGLESDDPLPFSKLHGVSAIERAILVDAAPIGRTSRSVPATFLGIFDDIRKLFAQTKDAQVAGFSASRFSFNNAEGRCSVCEGAGVIVSEMSFLPVMIAPCEACGGLRFEQKTLQCRYLGYSIGEVLQLPARDAKMVFAAHTSIFNSLSILDDLGLGYIEIGQGANTLSGGEAQRLKIASELASLKRHKPTLYVLDEPTTGLHLADVRKLIAVLRKLVDRCDTVVVIEHHPEVMLAADRLVELGPEAGKHGGYLIADGTPSEVAKKSTPTGRVLAAALGRRVKA